MLKRRIVKTTVGMALFASGATTAVTARKDENVAERRWKVARHIVSGTTAIDDFVPAGQWNSGAPPHRVAPESLNHFRLLSRSNRLTFFPLPRSCPA
jgi:hypothetical protein